MSLVFGANANDTVNYGSGASIDNLDPVTFLCWLYPTTLTGSRAIVRKGTTPFKVVRLNSTGGNVQLLVDQASDTSHITNDTPLSALNTWHFLAVSWNSAGASGEMGQIYHGTLSALAVESTYGTVSNGSGAIDESGGDLTWGNGPAGSAAFQGRIGPCAVVAKEMTRGEIRAWQFRPHKTAETRQFSWLGYSGTGTQPDWSGNGNVGTPSGPTLGAGVPLPPPFAWMDQSPYAVAAAGNRRRRVLMGAA